MSRHGLASGVFSSFAAESLLAILIDPESTAYFWLWSGGFSGCILHWHLNNIKQTADSFYVVMCHLESL